MKTAWKFSCAALALLLFSVPFQPVRAAKYSEDNNSGRQFAGERPLSERRAPPPEASDMPLKDLEAVAPITFDEMRLFVRDWRKYARWLKSDGHQYQAVAYMGVSHKADYPPEVVKWMDAHGWATDRFFLLERKFRQTLSVLEQENKRTNLVRHLEYQLDVMKRDTKLPIEERREKEAQLYKNIRDIKDVTDVKAPVTPEEYELIKLNKDALETILSE